MKTLTRYLEQVRKAGLTCPVCKSSTLDIFRLTPEDANNQYAPTRRLYLYCPECNIKTQTFRYVTTLIKWVKKYAGGNYWFCLWSGEKATAKRERATQELKNKGFDL